MRYISRKLKNKPLMCIGIIGLLLTFTVLIIFHDATQKGIINEIVYDASGEDGVYNLFSISIYAIIAILSLLILNQKFIDWEIKVDEKFVISMIPFIIFGGLLRVSEDANLIPYPLSILAVSPFVYFIITVIIILIVYIIKSIVKDEDESMYKHILVIGSTLAYLSVLPLLNFQILPYDYTPFWITLGISISCGWGILFIIDYFYSGTQRYYRNIYILVIICWCFDLAATSFGITQLDYVEKNIMSSLIINTLGVTAFKVEKLLFPIAFCLVFEYRTRVVREEPRTFDWVVLLTFVVLSLAPAVRNIVRIALGF